MIPSHPQDLSRARLPPPVFKGPSGRSWPLESRVWCLMDRLQKGAWLGRMRHRPCVSEQLAANGSSGRRPEAAPWQEPLPWPMDFKVGLREVRS